MATDSFGFPILRGWPEIDAAGMAEVDLLMVGTYGISLPQMMENAGRALAVLARDRFLGEQGAGCAVTVLAGSGGNGGGALTSARRLIPDGLFGYSLNGGPRGRAAEMICWANAATAPVLALDVQSAFDAQIGTLTADAIRAAATLTLALPKRELAAPALRHAVGDLHLADISVPPGLYECLTTPRIVPPFSVAEILRLPT